MKLSTSVRSLLSQLASQDRGTADGEMTQLGNEGVFSYEPVPVGSKSGWANPIADEIARAAFMTAAASAGT